TMARVGPVGPHLAAVGQDVDRFRDPLCLGLRLGLRLDHRDDLDARLIPAVHGDSAILAPVDVEGTPRGQREVADLAETLLVAAVVVAVVEEPSGVAGLRRGYRCGRYYGGCDQTGGNHESAHDEFPRGGRGAAAKFGRYYCH